MEKTAIWIILAAVLGTLVLLLTMTLALFFWKRNKRRIRGFSIRAVTPLDDAEFESWRKPCQYTTPPEKQAIRPVEPIVVRSPRTTSMFEKELMSYEYPRTPSPTHTIGPAPTSPIRKPERVRRKSSASSSIADRPPTPYSPTSTSGEFPRRGSHASRKSAAPHNHYPSMSEASAFEFNFGSEYGSPPYDPSRPSLSGDRRPLHLSYARNGESV
jgi:hypothetical protein